jgi:hypothetical protein
VATPGGFIEVGVDVLIVIVILFWVIIAVVAVVVTTMVLCLSFVTFWNFVRVCPCFLWLQLPESNRHRFPQAASVPTTRVA